MAGKLWQESASLLIIGRATQTLNKIRQGSRLSDADYRVVFLKRSSRNKFMPNAYVFPGGVMESSDFSPAWLDVFKKCGYSESSFKELRTAAPPPPLYKDKLDHLVIPEVGFRITAIRETFEESGLLLASHLPENCLTQEDITKWRDIVHKDASQFMTLFHEVGGCPAVWDLHEWIGYLTPAFLGMKRFDTAFYITFLNSLPRVVFDKREMSGMLVSTPQSILEKWHEGVINIAPPQLYELNRLLNFQSYEDLKTFAEGRGRKGLDSCFFVRIWTSDGSLSVLPGDDLYPSEPDYLGEKSQLDSTDVSAIELRRSANKFNRIELRSPNDVDVLVNVDLKYGHIRPLNYLQLLLKSNL